MPDNSPPAYGDMKSRAQTELPFDVEARLRVRIEELEGQLTLAQHENNLLADQIDNWYMRGKRRMDAITLRLRAPINSRTD